MLVAIGISLDETRPRGDVAFIKQVAHVDADLGTLGKAFGEAIADVQVKQRDSIDRVVVLIGVEPFAAVGIAQPAKQIAIVVGQLRLEELLRRASNGLAFGGDFQRSVVAQDIVLIFRLVV